MEVEHEWSIDNCVPVHFTVEQSGQWRAKKLIYTERDSRIGFGKAGA
jgi:hypothetical protein